MKLEKGYHFLIIFLWPSTVCKYGTGKTGRTSYLGLNCGTGNGWNRLWNRGAPSFDPREEHERAVVGGGPLQAAPRLRQGAGDAGTQFN